MTLTDDGIEMTATEARRLTKQLSAAAILSLGAILMGLALYFTPWREVGGALMLWALVPTVCTVTPLLLVGWLTPCAEED